MPKLRIEVHKALSDLSQAQRMLARARRSLGRGAQRGGPNYLVDEEWQWADDLLEARRAKLHALPNVVGVGLGFRTRKGERVGTPCITVYVRKKRSVKKLRAEAMIPRTLSLAGHRIGVDVVELGDVQRLAGTTGIAAPGNSIGPSPLSEKGTLGAFARDVQKGDVVGITAMHVTSLTSVPPAGQVCLFQTPCPGQLFGQLRAGTLDGIDAATLALDTQPPSPTTVLPTIGTVRGWRPTTFPGDEETAVRIFGATSGFQMGTLKSPATSIPAADLTAAILVDIPTQGGDSGCALIDPENLLLGFLVGRGSSSLNNLAVFTPASLVLSRLNCDIPSV